MQIIEELKTQADNDMGAARALQMAGYYGHALFWAHLALEKLCKALWVKKNVNEFYPRIHNLIKLLKGCDIELDEEQILFYSDMNTFQSKGRYGEELSTIERTITKEKCENYFQQSETQIIWLKNQLR